MNSSTPTAYSTDDPAVVAAYLAAQQAESEFARKVIADAQELGKNKGVMRTGMASGEGYTTTGLAPDDPDDPPSGWVYAKGKKMLVPVRGKAGNGARQWLKEHQPPAEANVRRVLTKFGLPANDMLGLSDSMSRQFSIPTVGHNDGVLWALYRGHPGVWYETDPQEPAAPWTKRKLSEFYAAEEAAAEARATTS